MVNLPFVQATISETQRVSRVAACSLLHRTVTSTNAEEFSFAKDSWFIVNLSAIMMDPLNFPHPAGFIGPDNRYEKNEKLIPFGIGKRVCMGEPLARSQVFLVTVNLLQRMKFLPP